MPKDLSTAFGDVLKHYRQAKKWSQMKLAMEAGMHLNALGNLERGNTSPSLPTLFALAKALEVPIGTFITKVEREHLGK